MIYLLAHAGHGSHGFADGFLHPITGLDHLLAMIAVGLWTTRADASPKRWWVLPATFVATLMVGLAVGVFGPDVPGVELGIQGSVIALGVLIAVGRRVPMPFAIGITALFALCHGHAHGVEIPADASVFTFALGMVLATAMLHLAGIGVGRLLRDEKALPVLRIGGGAIAAVGVLLIAGLV